MKRWRVEDAPPPDGTSRVPAEPSPDDDVAGAKTGLTLRLRGLPVSTQPATTPGSPLALGSSRLEPPTWGRVTSRRTVLTVLVPWSRSHVSWTLPPEVDRRWSRMPGPVR